MDNPSVSKFLTFPTRPTEDKDFFIVSRSRRQKKYAEYEIVYTYCSGPDCKYFREGEIAGERKDHACVEEETKRKYKYMVVVKNMSDKNNKTETRQRTDEKKKDGEEELEGEEEEGEGEKEDPAVAIKQIHPKLGHVDDIFFNTEDVACVTNILRTIPTDPTNQFLNEQQKKYEKSLGCIDEQLSKSILSHYTTFVTGMTQIQELGTDLRLTMNVCREGKSRLGASKQIARDGLELIAKHRRYKNLQETKKILVTISTYKKCENTLKKYMLEDDLGNVVEFWKDYVRALNKLRDEKALPFLKKSDKDHLKQIKFMIVREMKECLLKEQLDEEKYKMILNSISKMKRSKKKFFFGNIEKIFKNEVKRVGRKFPNLVENPNTPNEVIVKMCEIMMKYQNIHVWHETNDPYEPIKEFREMLWKEIKATLRRLIQADHSPLKIEDFFQVYKSYHIFGDIGSVFSPNTSNEVYVNAVEGMSNKFFRGYHKEIVVPRLLLMLRHECWIDLGNVSFKKLSFQRGDINRYQKLRSGISGEVCGLFKAGDWEGFTASLGGGQFRDIPVNLGSDEEDGKDTPENKNIDRKKKKKKKEEEEEGESDEDEDESDDDFDNMDDLEDDDSVKRRRRRQKKRVVHEPPVLVTNLTKELRKYLVIYVRSMEILNAIRGKVIFPSFKILMYFYIYSLYALFSSTSKGGNNNTEIIPRVILPEKDQRLSESIQSFFMKVRRLLDKSSPGGEFLAPQAQNIDVEQRCCMIESFNVLIQFLGNITDMLKMMVNPESVKLFNQELNKVITDVKLRFYGRLCKLYFPRDMNEYETIISNCRYSLKNTDPSDKVNDYVESFLRDFRLFKKIIDKSTEDPLLGEENNSNITPDNSTSPNDENSKKNETLEQQQQNEQNESSNQIVEGGIREYSRRVIWKIVIETCFVKLLNGYSKVKKCDMRGRGQMKYDFVTFESELKRLVGIESIWPKKIIANVQGYITAFYFVTFETLRDWLKENKGKYSKDNLKSLVNLKARYSEMGMKLNKKAKDELIRTIME